MQQPHPQIWPYLYTFRRCPYAIRARLALAYSMAYSGFNYEIREIILKDKPPQMLALSPKGTVPVLVLPDGTMIDESIDIMYWALNQPLDHSLDHGGGQRDPACWISTDKELDKASRQLIAENDGSFKGNLDRYKYFTRYPQQPQQYYREAGEVFLRNLEQRLEDKQHLFGAQPTLADYAIFPFVRQFSGVEPQWFAQSDYVRVRAWLEMHTASALFLAVMKKYPLWRAGDEPLFFMARS